MRQGTERGYTLIEILVVLGIIGILSGITLAAISAARSDNGDSARVSELGEYQLALKLLEVRSGVLSYNSGTELGTGQSIDSDLAVVMTSLPAGADGRPYYYDSSFDCGGINEAVLYTQMANAENGNFDRECGSGDGSSDMFVIVLE